MYKKWTYLSASLCLVAMLSGCSMLTNTIARSASDIATQNMMRVVKEVEGDKTIHITVVGHAQLNPSRDGTPRPLAYCTYLVRAADWRPAVEPEAGQCVGKERDPLIVDVSRSIVAPNQIQQQQFRLQGTFDLWLVMTADYGVNAVERNLYRQMLSGRGWIHNTVWATATGFFGGAQPLGAEALPKSPEPQTTSARAGEAATRRTAKPASVERVQPAKAANRSAQIKVHRGAAPVDSAAEAEPLKLNLTSHR